MFFGFFIVIFFFLFLIRIISDPSADLLREVLEAGIEAFIFCLIGAGMYKLLLVMGSI